MEINRRDKVFSSLNDIVCNVLDLETVTLHDHTVANDIFGWDSLAHIRLILAIENHFNLQFAVTDVPNLRNVGELVDRIIEHIE